MLLLRWLASIVILPGTVLVAIPAGLIYLSPLVGLPVSLSPIGGFRFWLASVPLLLGATMAIWTMSLFLFFGGDGTPAPWDPPKRLVIRGPYRHVRNPMIVGVILVLVGMGILTGSILIVGWTALFFAANSVYFAKSEEPALLSRFGGDYATYCKHVNRWMPRVRPWDGKDQTRRPA